MNSARVWILLVSSLMVAELNAQKPNPFCAKIDFNHSTVRGFHECKYIKILKPKRYQDTPDVPPYRSSSKFYLSNELEGLSCAESTPHFQLNNNTLIEAAIYLKYFTPGAFVEINIKDLDKKKNLHQWKIETSGEWNVMRKRTRGTVKNAQFEIRTNANKNSQLAIEYIYIMNKAINSPECELNAAEPTKPPSDNDSTLSSVTSTDPTTPANTPSTEQQSGNQAWAITGIVFGIILLIFVVLLVVYFVIRFKRRERLVVAHKSTTRSMNTNNNNNHSTLPRLRVVNDKISGVTIVGGGSNDNNIGMGY